MLGGDSSKGKSHTSATFYDDKEHSVAPSEQERRRLCHSSAAPGMGASQSAFGRHESSLDLLEYINQQNTSSQNHCKPHIEKRVDTLSPYLQIKKKTFMKNYNLNTIQNDSYASSEKQKQKYLKGNLSALCKDTLIHTDYEHKRNKSNVSSQFHRRSAS